MAKIRPARSDDIEALYHIALATGASGGDASYLYRDPKMVGHVYAAPYLLLSPECAFVAEDERGVAGYIVGAVDTPAFEALLEERWWPSLRPYHDDPAAIPFAAWTADQLRAYQIHHPRRTPEGITDAYPAHLHINLLPRLQGQGVGKRMMERWLETARGLGARGVHLGANVDNTRAIEFYRAQGWMELAPDRASKRTVWMAMAL
jgi:ribosomal protein S18 acetylase RimI-like enzyme